MKTVLVCAAQAPFVTGGAEILVRDLAFHLARRGFRADVVALPFHAHPPSEVVRQALAWRLLELRETNGRAVDLVIPTKFPSYLVPAPRKVAWLFHQHREAYDLFGAPLGSFGDGAEDRRVREAVHAMDAAALGECQRVFTISRNVANRLARHNGLAGTPLHPPPRDPGRYRTDGYGDYLFYAGRLERIKRVDLALRALAASTCGARLKIAGQGSLEGDLRRLAATLGVGERVDFLGFVSDEDLVALYAGCRAAWYTPQDEDYGYVTVESFLSRKPVVTSTDAGGPLEFVEDGVTGVVAAPEPRALAEAIDRLFALPEARLREMGAEARGRVRAPVVGHGRGPPDGDPAVRLALWTPRPDAAWVAALVPLLEREVRGRDRGRRRRAGGEPRSLPRRATTPRTSSCTARCAGGPASCSSPSGACTASRAPRPWSTAAARRTGPRPVALTGRPAPSSRGRWNGASAGICLRCWG